MWRALKVKKEAYTWFPRKGTSNKKGKKRADGSKVLKMAFTGALKVGHGFKYMYIHDTYIYNYYIYNYYMVIYI